MNKSLKKIADEYIEAVIFDEDFLYNKMLPEYFWANQNKTIKKERQIKIIIKEKCQTQATCKTSFWMSDM